MKKLLFVVIGLAAASAMADITLDGPTFVSTTTTVSEKVTGSGYYVVTDGATLTLSNGENDFTGGVIVSNGMVKATAENALGTGDIYLSHGSASTERAQVVFAANGTYANNIIKTGKGFREKYPNVCTAGAGTDVTLTGKISMACEGGTTTSDYLFIVDGSTTSSREATTSTKFTLTIRGDVDMSGGRVVLYAFRKDSSWVECPIHIYGKITAYGLFTGWGSAHQGNVYVYNPENAIGTVYMKLFKVHLMETNVVRNADIYLCGAGQGVGAENAAMHMNGHDQIVGLIYGQGDAMTDSSTWSGKTCGFLTPNAKPCTLTVTGPGGNSGQLAIMGPVDFTVRYPDDRLAYTQTISRRWSSTTGNVRIEAGRLNMARYAKIDAGNKIVEGTYDSARFSNVTNLYVSAKGELELNEATTTFPAMKDITIDGACYVKSLYEGGDIYAADTKLHLGTDAHYYVRTGCTNTVNKLYVGGRYMPAGTYTKDDLPQMNYAKNPTYYGGALVVTKGAKGLLMLVK